MRRWALWAMLLSVSFVGSLMIITIPRPPVAAADFARLDAGADALRGRTVFFAGGCASCHATPGQDDHLRLGGGFALTSPYGTFYAPNISPDPIDGIGNWSAGDLANAMLAGVSPAGSSYYPAFPYTSYVHAKIEDISDLMAFIRTLPPIPGKAPKHDLRFPFNMRMAMNVWRAIFLPPPVPITADAAQSAAWNRGNYLANSFGHCAECHSPRGMAGNIIEAQRFAGGPDLEGKGWVPNITQASDGLGKWSQEDIDDCLKTGFTPEGDSVGGTMAAVVRNMAALSDEDRMAIAIYIRSLPARQGPTKPTKKAQEN